MILSNTVVSTVAKNRFKTLEADLVAVHGDNYDFTMACHINVSVKLMVWCKAHLKFFWIDPHTLLKGSGCPKCGAEKVQLTKEKRSARCGIEFAEKAESVHPNKYDYTMVWYRGGKTKILIWCNSCKKFFWINPTTLLNGRGCKKCGRERSDLANTQILILHSSCFAEKAEKLHPCLFDYTMAWYRGSQAPITLWCKSHNGFFWTTPNVILSKRGCLQCASTGFKPNLPATLYYLRVETRNQICYKIGITNRTVHERFGRDMVKITIIDEWAYDLGSDAYDEEQRILKQFKAFQYKGDPLLDSGGNTELFNKDILELDRELEELK